MEECQPGFSGLRKTAGNGGEKEWLRGLDLNQRPLAPGPGEAGPHGRMSARVFRAQEDSREWGRKGMVAGVGFEPTTSGPRPRRSRAAWKNVSPGFQGSGRQQGMGEKRNGCGGWI